MLTHVWIIPLIPAITFVAILAVGKRLPKKGAELGIASVAICLVLALTTGIGWINRVNHPPESAHETAAAVDPPAVIGLLPLGEHSEVAAGDVHHNVTGRPRTRRLDPFRETQLVVLMPTLPCRIGPQLA